MRRKSRVWRAAALACAAAALAAGAWLWLHGGDVEEASEAPAPAPRRAKAARAGNGGRTGGGRSPASPRRDDRVAASRQGGGTPTASHGGGADAAGTPPPPGGADGAGPSETNAVVRTKPLFRHGAEQLLAMATPTEPGGYVPPLPEITDEGVAEDLAKAMRAAIGPSSNDTERTLEIKLNVAQQKEEFRELREEGMTFVQYVNALRDKFNDDAAFLAEARRLDEALFGDAKITDEQYKSYRAELNKQLRERGLPEMEER